MAENEIVDPHAGVIDDGGYGESADMQAEIDARLLPEAEGIVLPIFMKKGREDVEIADAIYDNETRSMVVKFNNTVGRDISNFIASGVLSGLTLGAQISRNKLSN
ncbi:hypothetical protein PBI_SPORTO_62 [Arthrobacter phage Sporto]|nr:hypothetical protein PBI_SPORTO_62 [Arthrobacter phage Sporto]